jgi:hypothetical protein
MKYYNYHEKDEKMFGTNLLLNLFKTENSELLIEYHEIISKYLHDSLVFRDIDYLSKNLNLILNFLNIYFDHFKFLNSNFDLIIDDIFNSIEYSSGFFDKKIVQISF